MTLSRREQAFTLILISSCHSLLSQAYYFIPHFVEWNLIIWHIGLIGRKVRLNALNMWCSEVRTFSSVCWTNPTFCPSMYLSRANSKLWCTRLLFATPILLHCVCPPPILTNGYPLLPCATPQQLEPLYRTQRRALHIIHRTHSRISNLHFYRLATFPLLQDFLAKLNRQPLQRLRWEAIRL